MESILDRILEVKRKEVQSLKEFGRRHEVLVKPRRSFINKLEKAREISVIAEFKRASPSKGMINSEAVPAHQAALYEEYGASAISVLTDATFFKGSFADLRAVREAVNLPILCKDFIIDPVQIDEAVENGADIILLIAAALENHQLIELYKYARERNLEVLVEVHNPEEAEKALKTGSRLIGINNRDLKTFHVSLEVTETVASVVKESGAFLVSESGIQGYKDVERVVKAGANAILAGEMLMRSSNIRSTFEELRLPLLKGEA